MKRLVSRAGYIAIVTGEHVTLQIGIHVYKLLRGNIDLEYLDIQVCEWVWSKTNDSMFAKKVSNTARAAYKPTVVNTFRQSSAQSC
jgi:hypothetical protein